MPSEVNPTPTGYPHPDRVPPPRQGTLFDIKRYAVNDGPGIRLAIFFKGCNLHCSWCHNPEGISPLPEKMYNRSRCIGCGTCVEACPEKALRLTAQGIVTDSTRCTQCGHCAEVCPSLALEMSGRIRTTDEVMAIIEREREFFEESGGGVTFTGGEPLMQPEFLLSLLEECELRGIHRAIDTAGHVNPAILQAVARHTDLFLYDLKLMDGDRHRKWTGVGNERILSNLKMLASSGAAIIIRIPLIAGVNDDERNIRETARFVAGLDGGPREVHLLPWHPVARNKYHRLGRPGDFTEFDAPENAVLDRTISIFASFGITALAGG
ncbi:MAG TPA: glycyl-radical enzyme activating protein [Bacteroidales bacterium]|nr:glycyl-radical enzyme activating protein [Bacteroidales bacterium]